MSMRKRTITTKEEALQLLTFQDDDFSLYGKVSSEATSERTSLPLRYSTLL